MTVLEVEVLGLPLANATLDEAAQHLFSIMPTPQPYIVCTPNPEMIERALAEEDLRRSLLAADLLLADGVGVLWASRVLGEGLPGTVPGVDLMDALLRAGASGGIRVFLLGTTRTNVEAAGRRAQREYPGLGAVETHHGYFSEDDAAGVLAAMTRFCPDLVLVGMGVPRDQVFLSRFRNQLPPALYLAVGGGLDVLSGAVRRAPAWMRRLRLEWLYRLATSPSRWRRQLALPRFVFRVLWTRLAGRETLR